MRLFIALELPQTVRDELVRAQGVLRGHAVRLTDPAGMHLTLQFLGEADEALVTPLLAALAAVAAPPCALRLAGLGAFPKPRQPRVIWAGVSGDLPALGALHAAVLAATRPLGFAPEERRFTPHLTLGRTRQDATPARLAALAEALAATPPLAPLQWEAGRPILFQSTLTPSGAVYTRLGPC